VKNMAMKSRISDKPVAARVRAIYNNGLGARAISKGLGIDVDTVQTEISYQQSLGLIPKTHMMQKFVYEF